MDIANNDNLIPLKSNTYIPWGCYDIVRKVISSKIFAPVWITGESGNGKTLGVEQACADEDRELILINISNETSEEDLIGSYTLEESITYEIDMDIEDYNTYLKLK